MWNNSLRMLVIILYTKGSPIFAAYNTTTACSNTPNNISSGHWIDIDHHVQVYAVNGIMRHSQCFSQCMSLGGFAHVLSPASVNSSAVRALVHDHGIAWVQGIATSRQPCALVRVDVNCQTQLSYNKLCATDVQCICQRPADDVFTCRDASNTTVHGSILMTQQLYVQPDQWNVSLSYCAGYTILQQPVNLTTCIIECQALGNGSTIATFTNHELTWQFLGEMYGIYRHTYWTLLTGNRSAQLTWPEIRSSSYTDMHFACLCQRPLFLSAPTNTTENVWMTVKEREYYVNGGYLTFGQASHYCVTNLNANMLLLSSPRQHFDLVPRLHIQPGRYWIDGVWTSVESTDSSMVLDVSTNGFSILTVMSKQESTKSICSRVVNSTTITSEASFMTMISNLTVNVSTTSRAMRKLTSAIDNRPEAKTVGGGVGLILVTVTVALILVLDFPCNNCRCKK